jgi:hypothetical protein
MKTMNKIIKDLQQPLSIEASQSRLDETIDLCIQEMRKNQTYAEPRAGFSTFLSAVFRSVGATLVGLQALTLLFACLFITSLPDIPKYLPIFMPLFVLAIMPAIFKSQYFCMNEIEAVTRASGAQIILAKLILGGAANLIGITVLLCLESYLGHTDRKIVEVILYCIVPYLICMVGMLRFLRKQHGEKLSICVITMLAFSIFWGVLAGAMPWLYETAAFGIWMIAFLLSSVFYGNELVYLIKMKKEGKMYGIIP